MKRSTTQYRKHMMKPAVLFLNYVFSQVFHVHRNKNISNHTTTAGDRKICFFICLLDREQFIMRQPLVFLCLISCELRHIQFIVFALFIRHKGSMCPLLDNGTFVEDSDLVAEFAGG